MIVTEASTKTLRDILRHLGVELDSAAPSDSVRRLLAETVDSQPTSATLWLTWSAIRGGFPTEHELVRFRRDVSLNGAEWALADLQNRAGDSIFGYAPQVEIVANAVIVDVHNTSSAEFISGIQRVVRETTSRWATAHDLTFVAWTDDRLAFRRLTPREEHVMRFDGEGTRPARSTASSVALIPFGGTVIVPELAAESERAERLMALAAFSNTKVSYIGYDCVPLTSGETAAAAMAAHFPLYLDAVAHADRVAAISQSTADEFIAWKKMLPSSGRVGPDVQAVFLGGDSAAAGSEDLAAAREVLSISGDEPIVLVVGSHEPRKNHLSVLHAARTLWNEGVSFRLVMIGSGSWNSAQFDQLAAVLIDQGMHLNVLSNATDSVLSASYRLASVSIFTSFHEGFGLPIVESLRAGTPVIASNVGSMAEIAAVYGGVISVDPHSDSELQDALRRVLTEPAALEAKRSELASNDYRTWEDYADATWKYLVVD